MQVVIDTTECFQDWAFAKFVRERLPLLKLTGHVGVIPSIVFEEQWAQLKRKFDDWWKDRPKGPAAALGVADISSQELESRFTQRRDESRSELVTIGVTIAPYPAVSHEVVIQRAVKRRKPFRDLGDKGVTGYNDTLIWYTVMECCGSTSEDVAFITNNKTDFWDGDTLAADLKSDLTERAIDDGRVEPFRNFGQFEAKHIAPNLPQETELLKQLRDGTQQRLNMREWLAHEGASLVVGRVLSQSEIGRIATAPLILPTVKAVRQVQEIRVTDARSITDASDQVIVYATAKLEVAVESRHAPVMSAEYAYLSNPTSLVTEERVGDLEIEFSLTWNKRDETVVSSELRAVRPGQRPVGLAPRTLNFIAAPVLLHSETGLIASVANAEQ